MTAWSAMPDQARRARDGGGGRNRTRVRNGSYEKLYTLSRLVFLSRRGAAERQRAPKPARKFHSPPTDVSGELSRIIGASSDRLGRTTWETSQLKLRRPASYRWLCL